MTRSPAAPATGEIRCVRPVSLTRVNNRPRGCLNCWYMEPWRRFGTSSMANSAIQKTAENGPEAAIVRALGRRSIVLVGMMGAGKSSVGRRLAARLGIAFVDADTEIESAAGMTIPEIFAQARRELFPRRRGARDRPAARQRPAGAGDRRRRGHGPDHPRPDPHQGHLGLAQGRSRRAAASAPSGATTGRWRRRSRTCCRCASRSMRCPTSSCSRATSRTRPSSTRSSPSCQSRSALRRRRHDRAAAPGSAEPIVVQGRAGRARLRHRHRPRADRELGRAHQGAAAGRQVRDRHRRDRGQAPSRRRRGRAQGGRHRQRGHRASAKARAPRATRPSRPCARRSSRRASSAAIWSSRSAAA